MKGIQFHAICSICLSLLAFTMILLPKLVTIPIALFFLLLIFGIVKKQVKFKFNNILLLFFLLYVTYLIGTFFTENKEIALKYLEYKLSFLLFPILFSFKFKEKISIEIIGVGLVLGTAFLGFLGIINSLYCFKTTNEINCFLSSSFSRIHHPSYTSVFYLFSIAIAWHGFKQKWRMYSKTWIFPLIIFFVLGILLCMSLAGLLFSLLFLFVVILHVIYKRFNRKIFSITIIGLPILFYTLLMIIPGVKIQFNTSVDYLHEYLENPSEFIKNKQTFVGGNETRLIMWTAASLEFKTHPFGVGTGNVDDHLATRLIDLGQGEMAKKNYNPHNQYLQTGLEIGWIGLIILLGIIFLCFQFSIRQKNWLLLLIITNLAFNMLFESMLQRQSGIVFYTFWICILVVYSESLFFNIKKLKE